MSRKLASTVHVTDPDGVSHAFGPDDDVPDWASKLITNPAAWADAEADDTDEPERPRRGPGRPPKSVDQKL